ncbi:hypothetical protein SAMN05421790_103242 [Kroppenstedtia eburnea]|uniref:Uncharacterized protein n=1 Tax=Kroppenstedtia eburnea TaxID=714067 RepID=A0A1N7KSF9_9BACL|nr:hypothetical protein SAMN05421790_103242 [Kroppenstedtia eburnea]
MICGRSPPVLKCGDATVDELQGLLQIILIETAQAQLIESGRFQIGGGLATFRRCALRAFPFSFYPLTVGSSTVKVLL